MKTSGARFPRRSVLRQVDEIIELAAFLDPGLDTYEDQYRLSSRQLRRKEERHFDFTAIGEAAQVLHDAVSTLR